jgi:hypothetical protein
LIAGGGPGLNEQQEAAKTEFLNREIAEISNKGAGFHVEVCFPLRTSHTECGDGI